MQIDAKKSCTSLLCEGSQLHINHHWWQSNLMPWGYRHQNSITGTCQNCCQQSTLHALTSRTYFLAPYWIAHSISESSSLTFHKNSLMNMTSSNTSKMERSILIFPNNYMASANQASLPMINFMYVLKKKATMKLPPLQATGAIYQKPSCYDSSLMSLELSILARRVASLSS